MDTLDAFVACVIFHPSQRIGWECRVLVGNAKDWLGMQRIGWVCRGFVGDARNDTHAESAQWGHLNKLICPLTYTDMVTDTDTDTDRQTERQCEAFKAFFFVFCVSGLRDMVQMIRREQNSIKSLLESSGGWKYEADIKKV